MEWDSQEGLFYIMGWCGNLCQQGRQGLQIEAGLDFAGLALIWERLEKSTWGQTGTFVSCVEALPSVSEGCNRTVLGFLGLGGRSSPGRMHLEVFVWDPMHSPSALVPARAGNQEQTFPQV